MKRIRTTDIPQANTLRLVGELVALMDAGIHDDVKLSAQIGIVPREIDYYRHAARILGFVSPESDGFVITDRGQAYLQAKRPTDKFVLLREAVREAQVFKELLHLYSGAELSKSATVEFLRSETDLTGSTLGRRANTIMAWLKAVSSFNPDDFSWLATRVSKQAPHAFHAYQDREEGPLHHSLKTRISENPALLGEPLTLVEVEYQFPTNDRADILFVDAEARYLAVEVEVDVGSLDVAGLLQAIKYRAMLVVQLRLTESNVRGMLAARSIHPVMKKWAERYQIQTREVSGVI